MNELDDFGGKILNRNDSIKESKGSEARIAEKPTLKFGNSGSAYSRLIQWSDFEDNKYLACGKTQSKLPAGLYDFAESDIGIFFNKMPINADEILEFPNDISFQVMKEIEVFWNAKERFKEYKFLHRRGYLFYGAAGNGKSMIVQLIIKRITERDGIAFLCGGSNSPRTTDRALRMFRTVEPFRHVVCIFEDIDSYAEAFGESNLLSLLDGENQLNDVLNIATTNYPEKLDKRIVGRPRRFDRLIKVVAPEEQIRELYLEKKLSLGNGEAKEWARKTRGFTFAALADLVISVKCLNKSLDESLNLLSKLINSKASSAEFETNKVGFNRD